MSIKDMKQKRKSDGGSQNRLKVLLGKMEKVSLLDDVPKLEAEDEYESQNRAQRQNYVTKNPEQVSFTVTRYPEIKPSKQSINVNRKIIVTANKAKPFVVIEDGMDRTPKRLLHPEHKYYCSSMDINEFGKKRLFDKPSVSDLGQTKSIIDKDFIDTVNKMKQSSVDDGSLRFSVVTKNLSIGDSSEYLLSIDQAPSMFHVNLADEEQKRLQILDKERLVLRIQETPTIELYSIRSSAACADTMEGCAIDQRNNIYNLDSLRIKKKTDAFAQTTLVSNKVSTTSTNQQRPATVNQSTFASVWDYMDMVQRIKNQLVLKTRVPTLQATGKVDVVEYESPEIILQPIQTTNLTITDPKRFYLKAIMIERILTGNNAYVRQVLFKQPLYYDYYNPDHGSSSEKISNTYILKFLWTFSSTATKSKCVNSLCWNFHDPNMLAVAYGRLKFVDNCSGLVCIWNVKNLVHPEREYNFEQPVRCLEFSYHHPNILSVGFQNGIIKLLDISSHDILVVGQNIPDECSLHYSLCDVVWMEDMEIGNCVVECLGNGHVNKYTDNHLKRKICLHHITKVKDSSTCHVPRDTPAALCIKFHPIKKNVYLLGSSEGAVYTCDVNNTQNYLSMFVAHNGPIFSIEFNPASTSIFLTCGADWCVKIWACQLAKPLITLTSGMTRMTMANWHPKIPTILMNLNEEYIQIWDITKELINPQVSIKCPGESFLSFINFSRAGNSICVGDADGNAHVFTFKDMPVIPKHPGELLAHALLEALSADSELKKEAKKLVPIFHSTRF